MCDWFRFISFYLARQMQIQCNLTKWMRLLLSITGSGGNRNESRTRICAECSQLFFFLSLFMIDYSLNSTKLTLLLNRLQIKFISLIESTADAFRDALTSCGRESTTWNYTAKMLTFYNVKNGFISHLKWLIFGGTCFHFVWLTSIECGNCKRVLASFAHHSNMATANNYCCY